MAQITEAMEPDWEPLFCVASHGEMQQMLKQALDLTARTREILTRIAADQDAWRIDKKRGRQADQRWGRAQVPASPGLPVEETPEKPVAPVSLDPGMPAEVVCIFSVLRGYLGSVVDREARDPLRDSIAPYLSGCPQPDLAGVDHYSGEPLCDLRGNAPFHPGGATGGDSGREAG